MILFNLQEKINVISICHEHNIQESLSTKIDIKTPYFRAIIKASWSLKESSSPPDKSSYSSNLAHRVAGCFAITL